jgi:autotransporter-associated beta strand protein
MDTKISQTSMRWSVAGLVLLLLFGAQFSAHAATFTWTGNGGSPNWSTGGNWDAGVPAAGSALVFPVTTHFTSTNDLAVGTAFSSISISGSGYNISGSAIATSSIVCSNATGTNAISLDIKTTTDLTITNTVAGATLSLANINMNTILFNGAGTTTVNGFINGGDPAKTSFTKDGAGTVILKSPSTLTVFSTWLGGTEIKAGVLQLGATDQIPDRSTLTIDAGATFNMGDFSDSVGGLAGAGTVSRGGLATSTHLFTTGTNNAASTFSGLIADSGKFQKIGTGDFILTGNNTLSGLVFVDQGALYINGAFPTAFAAHSPGILRGTGSIGSFTDAGGAIGAGTPTANGILTVQSMDLSGGGSVNVRLNGNVAGTSYDQLVVAGAINLTGSTLTITAGGGAFAGDKYTIIKNNSGSAITGTFNGLPEGTRFAQAGNEFVISYVGGAGNDLVLTNGSGTVSGSVKDASGNGVAGITVSNGGSSTITAADGSYSLSIPDGPVTITPSKPGVTFSPASINLTGTGVPIPGQNFTATVILTTISGTVTNAQGLGVAGVIVSDGTRTATTTADGKYTINGVPFGDYTITPSKSVLTFTPATRSVSITDNTPVTGQDFALVPVVGADPNDNDGDGFPNEVEVAATTDPNDPTSTPFSGQPAGAPVNLNIKALSVKLAFSATGKDSVAMTGVLPVPNGFVSTGQQVIVDIGGVAQAFSLDSKGMSTPKSTANSFKLAKAKNGSAAYSLKLSKGSFATPLAAVFPGTADAKNAPVSVTVQVYFNMTKFQTIRAMKYTAKKGKTGSAK